MRFLHCMMVCCSRRMIKNKQKISVYDLSLVTYEVIMCYVTHCDLEVLNSKVNQPAITSCDKNDVEKGQTWQNQ